MQYDWLDNDSVKKFNIDLIKTRIKEIIKGTESLDNKIRIPHLTNENDQVSFLFYDFYSILII